MIVGHVGIALAARSWRRDAPLLWLVGAAVAPDILDGAYAIGNVCNPYGVYSHSLPAITATTAILALIAFAFTRSLPITAVTAAVVLLHPAVDYLTGVKALWPHGPVVGLYLYRWPLADFALELPLIVGGWWLVRRAAAVPRWMATGAALAALLLVQAAFDVTGSFRDRVEHDARKNACLASYAG